MKQHDYEGLNDAQCVRVDYFIARLERHRYQNLSEGICRALAGGTAQTMYPLTDEERRGVEEYLLQLLGELKEEWRMLPLSDKELGIIRVS